MATTDTVKADYDVSGPPAQPQRFAFTQLVDTSPVKSNPALVANTTGLGGVIESVDGDLDLAILDVSPGRVTRQNVRNVATYAAGAEATWAQIIVNKKVYYDTSGTLPTDCHLSLSPLNSAGGSNKLWGVIVMTKDETAASYPKTTGANPGATTYTAVKQLGISGAAQA